jgi:hypothetical protein
MMFRCTTRFDLQEEENALIKDFFTAEEIEASKEEEREEISDQTNLFELDPISSDEEDAPQEDEEEPEEAHQATQASGPPNHLLSTLHLFLSTKTPFN